MNEVSAVLTPRHEFRLSRIEHILYEFMDRSGSFLIDGEVVIVDARGVASFNLLRGRAREAQAFVRAFDLLELDGTDHGGRLDGDLLTCEVRCAPETNIRE